MKLSLRGEYALRALMVLGDHYGSNVVRIHHISTQQDIPQRFLEQILNDLKTGGFVESKRGIAGGYRLAKPPEELALAPVIDHPGSNTDNNNRHQGDNHLSTFHERLFSCSPAVRNSSNRVLDASAMRWNLVRLAIFRAVTGAGSRPKLAFMG